jgi:hypothetical protein
MVIKYRCWDRTKKVWRHANPDNMVSVPLSEGSISMRIIAPSEYILVLYTGFDDREGTDVFCGDILDGKYFVDWDILNGCWIMRSLDGKNCNFSKYHSSEHVVTSTVFEEKGWDKYLADITSNEGF